MFALLFVSKSLPPVNPYASSKTYLPLYVVPVKYQTAVNNQTAEILLPANSVAVVVF